MKTRAVLLSTILFSLMFPWVAFAQNEAGQQGINLERDDQFKKRARLRTYPGGRDEDSLKVQSQLPQLQKKGGEAEEALPPEPQVD